MLNGSAKLTIDFGNSQTRMVLSMGSKHDTKCLPNVFTQVSEDYEIPENYKSLMEEPSYLFKVHGSGEGTYIGGLVASREARAANIKPSALQPKYRSISTILSMNLVMYEAYQSLSRLFHAKLDQIDVTWDLVVLLPPVDMANKAAMIEHVSQTTEIDFTEPEAHFNVKYDSIKVLPEGLSAFFAVLFDKNKNIRKEFKDFGDKSVLVLDIGAGTTDLAVIEDYQVIDSTRDTIRIGGNNLYQKISRALRERDIVLSESRVQQGIFDGYVQDGSVQHDIVDLIDKFTLEVAQSMTSAIRSSFDNNMYNPRDISYLLVVGGGAISGKGHHQIAEELCNYMRELSPNISIVKIPQVSKKVTDEDGKTSTIKESMDIRMLNLIGANLVS